MKYYSISMYVYVWVRNTCTQNLKLRERMIEMRRKKKKLNRVTCGSCECTNYFLFYFIVAFNVGLRFVIKLFIKKNGKYAEIEDFFK